MRKSTILIAAALLAATPSWSQKSAPPRQAARQAQPAPDRAVEKRIRDRFARSKIHEDAFRVHVENGVAVIEGKTDVSQHKGVATRLAKSAGAKKVDNRVVVSEAGKQALRRRKRGSARRVHVQRSEKR